MFSLKQKVASKVIIDAVYKMIVAEDNNPFAKPAIRAKVLDTKNGWVKYGLLLPNGEVGMFNNESEKEESFLRRYELEDTFIKFIKENQ